MEEEVIIFKCGEIYVSKSSTYTYLCTICTNGFLNIDEFHAHCWTEHLEPDLKFSTGEVFRPENEILIVKEIKDEDQDILPDFSIKNENCLEETNKSEENKLNTELLKFETFELDSQNNNSEYEGSVSNSCNIQEKDLSDNENSNHTDKFVCSICEKTFISKVQLKDHFEKHTDRKICPVCDIKFLHLKQHMTLKHPDYSLKMTKFQCKYCEKKFLYEHTMRVHEKRHENLILSCKYCNKHFKHPYLLTNHLRKHENKTYLSVSIIKPDSSKIKEVNNMENNKIVLPLELGDQFKCEFPEEKNSNTVQPKKRDDTNLCPICETSFPQLKLHMKLEHPSHSVKLSKLHCKYCKLKFLFEPPLKVHEKQHENFALSCEYCGKHYKRKFILRNHILTHGPMMKCKFCTLSFSKKEIFENHVKRHEARVCKFCKRYFKNNYTFTNHMRTHTGERPFECEICSVRFALKSNLDKHKICIHSDERNFPCQFDDCDKAFKTSQLRTFHEKRMHLKEKTRQCEICGLNFANTTGLKRHHMALHSDYNNRRHHCTICEKKFVELSHLKEHLNVHSGNKPYQCDVCGSSFAQSNTLRSHKKIHTGEKKHKCKVCSKSFAQHSGLYCHMKLHQIEKEFKI